MAKLGVSLDVALAYANNTEAQLHRSLDSLYLSASGHAILRSPCLPKLISAAAVASALLSLIWGLAAPR